MMIIVVVVVLVIVIAGASDRHVADMGFGAAAKRVVYMPIDIIDEMQMPDSHWKTSYVSKPIEGFGEASSTPSSSSSS